MRSKEEAERKARLERLRKQKAERERVEKKRQEQEAARATETFFRDRATSVEPSGPKSTVSQDKFERQGLANVNPAQSVARRKEGACQIGQAGRASSKGRSCITIKYRQAAVSSFDRPCRDQGRSGSRSYAPADT